MRPDKWLPMYNAICREFMFSKEADLASAEMLASLLGDKSLESLNAPSRTIPETVLVCGGSSRLAEDLSSISAEGFVVAADGATTILSDAGIRVDMIVTDLDGIVEDQVECNSHGSIVFLHAHGDNQGALKRWTKQFQGPVVGTCQCPPPPGLVNYGGFTDGDRAACICAELGVRTLRLAGFDFHNPSEKNGKNREVKKRKLKWAKAIIDELEKDGIEIVSALD